MLGQSKVGAELTHLDQYFLVIVRPQGFAETVTHHRENNTYP